MPPQRSLQLKHRTRSLAAPTKEPADTTATPPQPSHKSAGHEGLYHKSPSSGTAAARSRTPGPTNGRASNSCHTRRTRQTGNGRAVGLELQDLRSRSQGHAPSHALLGRSLARPIHTTHGSRRGGLTPLSPQPCLATFSTRRLAGSAGRSWVVTLDEDSWPG
ncbi:hypothetical protein GQ54DRAFT_204977 [Martensiomyces pterosporus]|nr:hypothetical protein GQ54DRAFT_204977 [Martensiomyces pterosporus]